MLGISIFCLLVPSGAPDLAGLSLSSGHQVQMAQKLYANIDKALFIFCLLPRWSGVFALPLV